MFVGFSDPFYTGSGVTTSVPGSAPISLNGRPYVIDEKQGIEHPPVPLERAQSDVGAVPGEQTISREEPWRRTQESWHHGAGQDHLDRPDSDPYRFRSSKGIDPWERWKLKLHHDTVQLVATVATNVLLAVAGDYWYYTDGNDLLWKTDFSVAAGTSSDIQAGESAQSVKSIASDGKTVYAALGSNGIHTTARGTTSSTHYSALSCTLVGYVKGRLMAANGNAIYNVTASGAAPSALFTHPNTDFTWVGFAEGPGSIYAAGYSGDKSLIYRTAVKADGTALDTPVIAFQLPDGEIVRGIAGYGGAVWIGTNKGWRLTVPDSAGNLVSESGYVDLGTSVRCFEGQENFVWYGHDNYDASSTGLGRMDPRALNNGVPAYASDLMATAQGSVLSVITFSDRRIFSVAASGVWAQDTTLVESGTIDSGLITYDMADTKIALRVDVRHPALVGEHAVLLAIDGGDFALLGDHDDAGQSGCTYPAGQARGETFELRSVLVSDGEGPEIGRVTLHSYPAPTSRATVIVVPVKLHETVSYRGKTLAFNVADELRRFKALRAARNLVTYQEGASTYTVLVDDLHWQAGQETGDGAWNGVCTLKLKEF